MAKSLVIVESPTKARTISQILGSEYSVMASVGHVRDLPHTRIGVTVTDKVIPEYLVPLSKREVVAEVKKLARDAPVTYLATDPDREGESISWHLARAAEIPQSKLKRVVFHEITPEAVKASFDSPREIDLDLVNAQQARRILDRLVGYKLSPLISKKLRWWGLSAGRVQSAALRIITERENEITEFQPQEYWTISVEFESPGMDESFVGEIHSQIGEQKRISITEEAQANFIVRELSESSFKVHDVNIRETSNRPSPPFVTSTLQQEAWQRLRFPARRTMSVAQQLYEGVSVGTDEVSGLITYMRTDSTNVAESAIAEVRRYISEKFDAEYLPLKPRFYRTKSKGAQEAHEAIRPTSVMRDPLSLKPFFSNDQFRLYELIWKRFISSQMTDSISEATRMDIHSASPGAKKGYLLRATASKVKFPGFRLLSLDRSSSNKTDENAKDLPILSAGASLDRTEIKPEQHFTQPPPRYSEASLIGTLEEKGIGRPSTYAAIVSTIQERGYVKRDSGRLMLLPLGKVVNNLVTEYFDFIVDLGFTAQMEDELDEIAQGKREWQEVLMGFYHPFAEKLNEATEKMPRTDIPGGENCDMCGNPMVLKQNRWGRTFLSCSGFPECRNAKPLQVKLGVECPLCSGDLVQKQATKGKRRSTFYGCGSFPTCNFTVNQRPLPEPCPQCGSLLLQKGRNQAHCWECSFEGQIPKSEPLPL